MSFSYPEYLPIATKTLLCYWLNIDWVSGKKNVFYSESYQEFCEKTWKSVSLEEETKIAKTELELSTKSRWN